MAKVSNYVKPVLEAPDLRLVASQWLSRDFEANRGLRKESMQ
jgi:hypothetical protein